MSLNELANNPLFTADESDDDRDDRRLATSSIVPRIRETQDRAPGGKKRNTGTGAANPRSSTGVDVYKLQGNKLFGNFDLKRMIGEDEVAFHNAAGAVVLDESTNTDGLLNESITERDRKKKEIQWSETAPIFRPNRMAEERINMEAKITEKKKEDDLKMVNGLLNRTLHFSEVEFNVEFDIPEAPVRKADTQMSSNFFESQYRPELKLTVSAPPQLGKMASSELTTSMMPNSSQFSLKDRFGHGHLKRPAPTELVRDREELKRVLHTTALNRRSVATQEDLVRLKTQSDFTKADESDEKSRTKNTDRGMDVERIVALEEGEEHGNAINGTEEQEEDGEDQDWEPPEEGFGEVEAEIRKVEELMYSDDENSRKPKNGFKTPSANHENGEGDSEDDEEFNENDEAEEGEEEEDDNKENQHPEESSDEGSNPEEAKEVVPQEEERKVYKRLKRRKDYIAERRAEKDVRRAERMKNVAENDKKRKSIMRNNDIFENEADLGEVVDGRDGTVQNIDSANPDENDYSDDGSRDLEGLVADLDILDEDDENNAFKMHIQDMIATDREALKRVIKGNFRQSIMIRQQEDRKRFEDEMRKRLINIKKRLDEQKQFTSLNMSKQENYQRLLGIDTEDLEGEQAIIEQQMKKEDKAKAKKESSNEKDRKKQVLGRLKISDVPISNQAPKRRFFDEGIKKNENLMKAVASFDLEKKTSTATNQIFVFRQKKPTS